MKICRPFWAAGPGPAGYGGARPALLRSYFGASAELRRLPALAKDPATLSLGSPTPDPLARGPTGRARGTPRVPGKWSRWTSRCRLPRPSRDRRPRGPLPGRRLAFASLRHSGVRSSCSLPRADTSACLALCFSAGTSEQGHFSPNQALRRKVKYDASRVRMSRLLNPTKCKIPC